MRPERSASNRLSTAPLAERPPSAHRSGQAFSHGLAEVGPGEQRASVPARGRIRHHRPGFGRALQPRRQVRRLAHHAPLARFAFVYDLAHDYGASGDADAGGQRPG